MRGRVTRQRHGLFDVSRSDVNDTAKVVPRGARYGTVRKTGLRVARTPEVSE